MLPYFRPGDLRLSHPQLLGELGLREVRGQDLVTLRVRKGRAANSER